MITSYNFPTILHQQIPEMKDSDSGLRPLLRVFAVINNFADFTGTAVQQHHYLLAGRCFLTADQCYKNGDRVVRALIKHSFLPALKPFMPTEDEEQCFIKSLIPIALYQLYESEITDIG